MMMTLQTRVAEVREGSPAVAPALRLLPADAAQVAGSEDAPPLPSADAGPLPRVSEGGNLDATREESHGPPGAEAPTD